MVMNSSPKPHIRLPIPRWIAIQILFAGYFASVVLPTILIIKGEASRNIYEIMLICPLSLFVSVFLTWAIYQSHVLFWGEMTKEEIQAELERERTSPEPFKYDEKGFSVRLRSKRYRIDWDSVLEVNLAKRDNYGWDTLYLGIKPAVGKPLVVMEDDPGYQYLLEQIFRNLPGADRQAHLLAMGCKPGYFVEIYRKDGVGPQKTQA